MVDSAVAERLAKTVAKLDDDQADWYMALTSAALDQTKDLGQALDIADKAMKEHPKAKPVQEQIILEAGFTGTVTDSLGRKFRYENGKRVASQHDEKGKGEKHEPPHESDAIHDYLDAFEDNAKSDTPPTADDANTANQELENDESDYRIVPDGKGNWMAAHVEHLEHEYGDNGTVAENPLTGKLEYGDADYYSEIEQLAGDDSSKSYLHSFNEDPKSVTKEDLQAANDELANDESDYRIAWSEPYDSWVAVPAEEDEEDEDEVEESRKRKKKVITEAGFTGIITDKAGRKRKYENGKLVKMQQGEPTKIEKRVSPARQDDFKSMSDEDLKSHFKATIKARDKMPRARTPEDKQKEKAADKYIQALMAERMARKKAMKVKQVEDLRAIAKPNGEVKEHGMANVAQMSETDVGGIKVRWDGESEKKAASGVAMLKAKLESMPGKLRNATSEVIFAAQPNKDDSHWAKTFDESGFKSLATGGDGKVVVYADTLISGLDAPTFAHESGHNLANKIWGSVTPDESGDYGKAQKAEKPVSEYGANNAAEDFAEACRMYADPAERESLQRGFPQKYKALEEILK